MFELHADNAAEYLRASGRIATDVPVEITRMTGGVSNEVLYVGFPERQQPDFVLKQARDRLRVPEPWHCSVTRIWREVDVLRLCESLLREANAAGNDSISNMAETRTLRTPRLLFEDRDHYCFAMTAAPRDHVVWSKEVSTLRSRRRVGECSDSFTPGVGTTPRSKRNWPTVRFSTSCDSTMSQCGAAL